MTYFFWPFSTYKRKYVMGRSLSFWSSIYPGFLLKISVLFCFLRVSGFWEATRRWAEEMASTSGDWLIRLPNCNSWLVWWRCGLSCLALLRYSPLRPSLQKSHLSIGILRNVYDLLGQLNLGNCLLHKTKAYLISINPRLQHWRRQCLVFCEVECIFGLSTAAMLRLMFYIIEVATLGLQFGK